MKQIIALICVFASIQIWADNKPTFGSQESKKVLGQYKYQVAVNSQPKSAVDECNNIINENQNSLNRRGLGDLTAAIATAYKSTLTQKTITASSNIIDIGITYLTQKQSIDFENWSKAKQQQCNYKKDLSSDVTIDDFYYRASTNGALDARDLKFNGFSCRNFIEVDQPKDSNKRIGVDAFYVSCKLRTDSLGKARLANHSKFMLKIDSLIFYPKYCNIPNINPKNENSGFDYNSCTNLELEIKVKILSSWVNELIMITSDYQLGEFTIRAKIDESHLKVIGNDTVFIYDKNIPEMEKLVTIEGESFIVPRSYVGTVNEPLWGTGQYKLVMEVSQTCQLKANHYIKVEEIGNVRAVNFANLPSYKKFNKAIWKDEWRKMKYLDKNGSFMANVWSGIKTAYIGTNWVKELADPVVTILLDYEAKELKGLFDLDSSSSAKSTTSNAQKTSSAAGSSAAPPAKSQSGAMPKK